MKTNIWLSKDEIEKSVSYLQPILATENILNLKIRNFHWNIVWLDFNHLYTFFSDLYEESSDNIDEIAERIRFLGVPTKASFSYFLENSFIKDEEKADLSEKEMILILLENKEKIIKELRKAILDIWEGTDMWTEDFLTGLIQKNEKNAWMLRSMLG